MYMYGAESRSPLSHTANSITQAIQVQDYFLHRRVSLSMHVHEIVTVCVCVCACVHMCSYPSTIIPLSYPEAFKG